MGFTIVPVYKLDTLRPMYVKLGTSTLRAVNFKPYPKGPQDPGIRYLGLGFRVLGFRV